MAEISGRLVHIVDDVPELEGLTELTMVVSLAGFLDAGQSADLAMQHLEDLAPGPVVATFDIDQLHDYRARRPAITFARDHYEAFEAPRLLVRLCHDSGGTPLLLLRGPEPDIRWEAFARGVREVIEAFGVTRTVSLGAVPMALPHTRPLVITAHANQPEILPDTPVNRAGELRVPASAQALLEVRLGEWGHLSQGYIVHVPHYLAQNAFPGGAVALLENLEIGARLLVDLTELREAADKVATEVAEHLGENPEVAEVVKALEQQYDNFERAEGRSLLAEDQALPTGEELGLEFERFLAGLDDGGRASEADGEG